MLTGLGCHAHRASCPKYRLRREWQAFQRQRPACIGTSTSVKRSIFGRFTATFQVGDAMSAAWRGILTLSLVLAAGTASADDTAFLKSLEGSWTGKGMVKTSTQARPVNVTCNFSSRANGSSLSMQGNCRGLLVVSRAISADLKASGTRYSGIYVGPAGGRSGLNGSRNGNTINLAVHWAKPVNGDRSAEMRIQKLGNSGMKLMTIDRDPGSGQQVTTSEINLQRKSGA
jgi:hypothetical protein